MTRIVKNWMAVLLLLAVTAFIGQTAEVGRADNQEAAVDAATAAAISESVLWNFGAANDGAEPSASLIFDQRGNLYGTTDGGGTNRGGTVFELSPPTGNQTQWSEHVLWNFGADKDGALPLAGLIFDLRGNLYGTTDEGGTNNKGTVFELSPPTGNQTQWSEHVLWNFGVDDDGAFPGASLIFDLRGNLYGTTNGGGTNGDGTVFELSPPTGIQRQWRERVLWNFFGAPDDGAFPTAGLIFDLRGDLYSTTFEGGTNSDGTVFELSPPTGIQRQWRERVLWNFGAPDDGAFPRAGVIFDLRGNLYGTTDNGGTNNNDGTVFELSPPTGIQRQWSERVLWNFFGAPDDGSEPLAGLIFDLQGNLYGTTQFGGTNDAGTVFRLSAPPG
jgi:uncharacterized repeat protein (TIGR03803 family)